MIIIIMIIIIIIIILRCVVQSKGSIGLNDNKHRHSLINETKSDGAK